MKKNIVITGYPKSGTHWLSRLTAELINAPLKGNWGINLLGQFIEEGNDRISDFECYKSHHTYEEIFDIWDKDIYKIIYVIRDPRDVIISGSHFYRFIFPGLRYYLYKLPQGKFVCTKLEGVLNRTIGLYNKRKVMMQAVLRGKSSTNIKCNISWKNHYESYMPDKALFIKYEDVLLEPVAACKRILEYLKVSKTLNEIKTAIENQSLTNRLNDKLDKHKFRIVRKGSCEYWKQTMKMKELSIIDRELSQDLKKFNYVTATEFFESLN